MGGKKETNLLQSYQEHTQYALLKLASLTTPIILIALAFFSYIDFFLRSTPEYLIVRLPAISLLLLLSVFFLTHLETSRPKWMIAIYYTALFFLFCMAYATTIMSWGTAYFYTTPTLLLLTTITIFLGLIGDKRAIITIYTIPTLLFLAYIIIVTPRTLTPFLVNVVAIIGFSIMYAYNEKTRERMFFAEQRLVKSNNRLKNSEEAKKILLDNIKTQVWYLTDKKTYGAVNNSHAEFYRKKISDMAFNSFDKVFDKKTASKMEKDNEDVFSKKSVIYNEEWTVDGAGKKTFLAITKTPQLNSDKSVEYVVCSAEDITVRKEFEDRMLESNQELEKFKLAVDDASDHIVITDPDGICLYANRAVEKTTGFINDEVIGQKIGTTQNWGGLMPPEFYAKLWHHIKEKKESFSGEIKNKRKNGEEYEARASIAPVLNKKREVVFFVGIERDITKEKQIDRAKTEFVSLASHQLRTPLATIAWYLELLLDGSAGKITKNQKSYLTEIHNGNQRMIGLVEALLNVSRLELGTFYVELQEVDVANLTKEIIKELSPQLNLKKQTLKEDIDKKLKNIKTDPRLLHIVLQNLLSNAIKYTPEKGKIKIAVKIVKRGDSVDSVKIKKESLLLEVSDNGYGIPLSEQDKIFSKLFRSKNAQTKNVDGTGLGLYIVKSIAERLGGKVWLNSTEGKGTTFFVALPINNKSHKKK